DHAVVDWYAVATLISCTTATADGLPRWTGLYMGAHVGWGRVSISGSDNMMALDEQTTVGWLGGGQLGCGWRAPNAGARRCNRCARPRARRAPAAATQTA